MTTKAPSPATEEWHATELGLLTDFNGSFLSTVEGTPFSGCQITTHISNSSFLFISYIQAPFTELLLIDSMVEVTIKMAQKC